MPANFLYMLRFDVKPEKARQFADTAEQVMKIHKTHPKGLGENLQFYTSFIGNGEVAFVLVPIDNLGAIDSWTHTPDLLIEALSDGPGQDLLNRWADSISSWESRIVRYSPEGH